MSLFTDLCYNKYQKKQSNMQSQARRWKGLLCRDEGAQVEVRQKPKKFTPTRGAVSAQFNKMKALNFSKQNSSGTDLQNRSLQQRQSFVKGLDKQEYKRTPSRNTSDFNLESKLRPSLSSNQELASPTILIKQLRQINQTQSQIQNNSKALFSLDQEHRYIHEQLFKIKSDFAKLKNVVTTELARYQKQIDGLVKKISEKLDQVLQTCLLTQQKAMKVNLDNLRDSGNPNNNNGFDHDMESLNFSVIKKQSSVVTDSKVELKKIFFEESSRIQKAISNKIDSSSRVIFEGAKTERLEPKSNPSPVRIPKQNSKKQFEKLFQAVNCLKRDIKDLNTLNVQLSKRQESPTTFPKK